MKTDLQEKDFLKFIENDYNHSFWIQYFSVKNNEEDRLWVNSLTKNILTEFITSSDERMFIDCRTIVLNLITSILLEGKWVAYTRQKKDYKKNNDKNAWMRYDNMVLITKNLVELGFICEKMGYYDIKSKWKNATKTLPTYKFYLFCLSNKVDQKSFLGEIQTINKNKDELVFNTAKDYCKGNSHDAKPKKIDVSNKEKTQIIVRLTKDVKKQNELSSTNFQAKLNISDYEKLALFKKFNKFDEILDTKCHRVFTNCNEKDPFNRLTRYGGRWYCECQNIPSKYRKNIEFSNDKGETWVKSIELDYMSLHPFILYAISGYNPGKTDLYDISEFSDIDETEFFSITGIKFRKLVKYLTLIMINKASNRKSAYYPLIKKLNEMFQLSDECKSYININLVNDVSKSILDKHSLIRDYFYCKGKVFNGTRDLMSLDSEICGKIRKLFLNKKLGIISIHDSFVVDIYHEDLLFNSMISTFKETLNCDFAPPINRIELGKEESVFYST